MRTVACPRCGTLARYETANSWRPFCSERCKNIDLGAWANEEYRIPAPPEAPQDSEPEAN
jgi:endogenous inhibitor of DNA gyrase (YacG/DUF329 family)